MNGKDIINLGYPVGPLIGKAVAVKNFFWAGYGGDDLSHFDADMTRVLTRIKDNPYAFVNSTSDAVSNLAKAWVDYYTADIIPVEEVIGPVKPYKVFDEGITIEAGARAQMDAAMSLAVTAGGALMPDAHQGYGLPIGGVWKTYNAVSPNAVGSDIGCQVVASVFTHTHSDFTNDQLAEVLMETTRFKYDNFRSDMSGAPIFSDPAWEEVEFLAKNPQIKEMAVKQYATSGDGNHFADLGYFWAKGDEGAWVTEYESSPLALVTHWGSRSLGARIAKHFNDLAVRERKHLPKEYQGLAWLYTDTELGQQYLQAMHLAVRYATVGHNRVHSLLAKELGTTLTWRYESVHNVATLEGDGWTHRKGATPANKGEFGVIPFSMVASIAVVSGKGNPESLHSASHGAGRTMSRGQAKRTLSQEEMDKLLETCGITLIGGGIDESPEAYKNPNEVLKAQKDCVELIGGIRPRVVRMAE